MVQQQSCLAAAHSIAPQLELEPLMCRSHVEERTEWRSPRGSREHVDRKSSGWCGHAVLSVCQEARIQHPQSGGGSEFPPPESR